MKRLYYIFIALSLAVSCKVVDPYQPNPMTDSNISNLSHNLFSEEAAKCLTIFYNAFHITRFLEADAEVKVSPEYDIIRTGLKGAEGVYTFDYDDYTFTKEGLFEKGGVDPVYTEVTLDDITREEFVMEGKRLSAAFGAIARFIELKHFETLYTGNMLRYQKGNITPKNEAVPEVLQPNVEIYKKEVKKALNA